MLDVAALQKGLFYEEKLTSKKVSPKNYFDAARVLGEKPVWPFFTAALDTARKTLIGSRATVRLTNVELQVFEKLCSVRKLKMDDIATGAKTLTFQLAAALERKIEQATGATEVLTVPESRTLIVDRQLRLRKLS